MTEIQLRYFQEAADRYRAEGAAEGKAHLVRTISRQLGRLVALPGPEALSKMEALPIEALEDLAEDLLDFRGPDDLDEWLARR